MEQLMVISAVGGDRTGVVHELTRVVLDCGGSIRESRMTTLGSEFAMLVLIAGNWHAISRMEQELARFAESSKLVIQIKRTEPKQLARELLPYAIDVVCIDQPGIVHNLAGFFAKQQIEMSSNIGLSIKNKTGLMTISNDRSRQTPTATSGPTS